MPTITPHLWYDTQAKEAAQFYTSIFADSQVNSVSTLHDTPSGDCDIVAFTVRNQPFMAISAGPHFTLNPAISFMVNFDPSQEQNPEKNLRDAWKALSEGGKALMPLQEYPFSKLYGWVEDKYGLSWQLILTNPEGDPRPAIMPALLFTGPVCNRAEEAGKLYRSVFTPSKEGRIARYPAGMAPDKEGSLMFSDFQLLNMWFVAMDSAHEHKFQFNEAVSFMVTCDTQAEIDAYWGALSAVPEAEQCGWLKDTFGVSWQVTPKDFQTLMNDKDPAKVKRVTEAFLKMKKFDIATLKKVAEGR